MILSASSRLQKETVSVAVSLQGSFAVSSPLLLRPLYLLHQTRSLSQNKLAKISAQYLTDFDARKCLRKNDVRIDKHLSLRRIRRAVPALPSDKTELRRRLPYRSRKAIARMIDPVKVQLKIVKKKGAGSGSSLSDLVSAVCHKVRKFPNSRNAWIKVANKLTREAPHLSPDEVGAVALALSAHRRDAFLLFRALGHQTELKASLMTSAGLASCLSGFVHAGVLDKRVIAAVAGRVPGSFLEESRESRRVLRDLVWLCEGFASVGLLHAELFKFAASEFCQQMDRATEARREEKRLLSQRMAAGQLFSLADVRRAEEVESFPPSQLGRLLGAFAKVSLRDESLLSSAVLFLQSSSHKIFPQISSLASLGTPTEAVQSSPPRGLVLRDQNFDPTAYVYSFLSSQLRQERRRVTRTRGDQEQGALSDSATSDQNNLSSRPLQPTGLASLPPPPLHTQRRPPRKPPQKVIPERASHPWRRSSASSSSSSFAAASHRSSTDIRKRRRRVDEAVHEWDLKALSALVEAMAQVGFTHKTVTLRWAHDARHELAQMDLVTLTKTMRLAASVGFFSRSLSRRFFSRAFALIAPPRLPPSPEELIGLVGALGELPFFCGGLVEALEERIAALGRTWMAEDLDLPPVRAAEWRGENVPFPPSPLFLSVPSCTARGQTDVLSFAVRKEKEEESEKGSEDPESTPSSLISLSSVPTSPSVPLAASQVVPWRPLEALFPQKVKFERIPDLLRMCVTLGHCPLPLNLSESRIEALPSKGLSTLKLLEILEDAALLRVHSLHREGPHPAPEDDKGSKSSDSQASSSRSFLSLPRLHSLAETRIRKLQHVRKQRMSKVLSSVGTSFPTLPSDREKKVSSVAEEEDERKQGERRVVEALEGRKRTAEHAEEAAQMAALSRCVSLWTRSNTEEQDGESSSSQSETVRLSVPVVSEFLRSVASSAEDPTAPSRSTSRGDVFLSIAHAMDVLESSLFVFVQLRQQQEGQVRCERDTKTRVGVNFAKGETEIREEREENSTVPLASCIQKATTSSCSFLKDLWSLSRREEIIRGAQICGDFLTDFLLLLPREVTLSSGRRESLNQWGDGTVERPDADLDEGVVTSVVSLLGRLLRRFGSSSHLLSLDLRLCMIADALILLDGLEDRGLSSASAVLRKALQSGLSNPQVAACLRGAGGMASAPEVATYFLECLDEFLDQARHSFEIGERANETRRQEGRRGTTEGTLWRTDLYRKRERAWTAARFPLAMRVRGADLSLHRFAPSSLPLSRVLLEEDKLQRPWRKGWKKVDRGTTEGLLLESGLLIEAGGEKAVGAVEKERRAWEAETETERIRVQQTNFLKRPFSQLGLREEEGEEEYGYTDVEERRTDQSGDSSREGVCCREEPLNWSEGHRGRGEGVGVFDISAFSSDDAGWDQSERFHHSLKSVLPFDDVMDFEGDEDSVLLRAQGPERFVHLCELLPFCLQAELEVERRNEWNLRDTEADCRVPLHSLRKTITTASESDEARGQKVPFFGTENERNGQVAARSCSSFPLAFDGKKSMLPSPRFSSDEQSNLKRFGMSGDSGDGTFPRLISRHKERKMTRGGTEPLWGSGQRSDAPHAQALDVLRRRSQMLLAFHTATPSGAFVYRSSCVVGEPGPWKTEKVK
uniref:Uncharacterized protein n=1 Tax=Chromera velia CCMP2878 TaxID=1169474 RepID=A0A0G4FPA1_9ALVE|eukprot:Cvel_18026.t1-p1 / transcript=Cvel_18026.t1 / gene=Cvel_18026 / organism=Chromera_velia_CCMP2878 / gene_product=hypothetical protein / transcript_product=hypothetical protein / location=Cvel_scaffold1471:18243-27726(-) / protein_length=1643 / sequence_SO=supercontig / SO=protein_coding / is_pseudo=false